MECYIERNDVEVKAGLEDILPLLDDRLIQHLFVNAYKTINLQYALAFLPEEIKNRVYRNLSIRIIGKIRNAVKNLETARTQDYSYFGETRTKLISYIGENINIVFGSPNSLIWKETKPEEKPQRGEKVQADPVTVLIKEIENACASKELYLPCYKIGKMSKEDLQKAFAAFNDRKNELQSIRKLSIAARLLPAASPLFENETLDTLDIDGEFTEEWPEFMVICGNVKSITLDIYGKLTEFPSWILYAVSLRKLRISTCATITYLPDWIQDLQSLTEIEIWQNEFKTLPDGIGNLKNLSKLMIESSSIEKLPDSIGNLSSLKELKLDSNELTSLPDSIGNLTNLAKLTIEYSSIEKFPDSIGNLYSLEELILADNKKLTSLPDSIGNLKELTYLSLCNSAVEILPDSIGNLQNLTGLSLEGSKIKNLSDSIGNLKKLATLILSGTAIEILPDTLANCTSLEYVDICDTNLKSLPNFITSVKTVKQSIILMPKKRGISYRSFCNYYYTLVETIFRFSEKARNEGILALEEELEDMSEDIFKTGIRLMVDGTDGAVIRELFTLKIEREHDYYIKKLMEIAMEGIINIWHGDDLWQIGLNFASMVDIKNNPLESACAKYLSGDFDAFDNIDFKASIQAEGEREEIIFIKRAVEVSELSRREGFLELEKHLDKDGIAERDVFEYGLPMVIDNWDYKDIDKELSLLIARETDPVRKNIAMAKKDALRMIMEGYNPRTLIMILAAYFDDDVTKDFLAEFLKD